jgi:hypothetical protein
MYSGGTVLILFKNMNHAPFIERAEREQLRQRLNQAAGLDLPEGALNKWPIFPISRLGQPQALESFLSVWDWYLDSVRSAARLV